MKIRRAFSLLVSIVLLLCAPGCKREAAADASKPLEQSFKSAEPEVQQAIASVNASLKSGNYAEATRTLVPVVSERPLSEQQKLAVGLALKQINQSVAANPGLDTKEMYELRSKMFHAVHDPGKRF